LEHIENMNVWVASHTRERLARKCWVIALLVVVAWGTASGVETAELNVDTGERLLVIAPHPDDESLGAGGLMQHVLSRAGSVRVVTLTAGDGYVEAVEHATGLLRPRPSQYIAYGEQRLKEVQAAVRELGGNRIQLDLLAFPDGGLQPLLHAHWRKLHPERSLTTDVSRPPYPEAEDPHVRYDGADLRNKLLSILRNMRPTTVVYPDPLDKHPDHSAAGLFTMLAINDWSGTRAKNPAPPPHLLAYLVHWKDWPDWPDEWDQRTPPPYTTAPPLFLPSTLPARGLARVALTITDEEISVKRAALARHVTQQEVIPYLLALFVRRTEPFTAMTRAQLASVESMIEPRTRVTPTAPRR
jgi:LmbE family N-acetylglucosaminyl deacetylase